VTGSPFGIFVITEADADAIRAVFNQKGELSTAIELRRRFPGVTDNAKARACVWIPTQGGQEHRRVDDAASPASPGDAAAAPQRQLAKHPTVDRRQRELRGSGRKGFRQHRHRRAAARLENMQAAA
jgi:hypothetical protein